MVDRRYSDFAWLVGQLASQHPGVIIPPIPEKQAVGRFSAEFVESRRRALEKFLVRVLGHEELGRSHWLVLFLQANEDALQRAKDEAKAAKPKITTASALAWFDSTVNTLANGKVGVVVCVWHVYGVFIVYLCCVDAMVYGMVYCMCMVQYVYVFEIDTYAYMVYAFLACEWYVECRTCIHAI
ncbi:hypothetical protein EON64_14595 [archaeon]|nr:MAG: hypothetical protein EON64_14595 [archaeon]